MPGTHVSAAELDALHAKGKCLTRHESAFKKGDKCSHRYGAYLQIKSDQGYYNYPKYKSFCGPGSFRTNAYRAGGSGATFPSWYTLTKRQPRKGDWDVGKMGALPGSSVKSIENFTTHASVPYWHNAHHIVPNSTLSEKIDDAGASDGRIPNLIRQGLLNVSYNLNDKQNMIVLPMDTKVAGALGLPRHIKGGEPGYYLNHPDYNTMVKGMLTPIINRYKAIVAKHLKESHPPAPRSLTKKALYDLAKSIHDAIFAAAVAKNAAGASLDELADDIRKAAGG
jgi:hypothetical protein